MARRTVKLVDLAPAWINAEGRSGIGISFRCMTGHCSGRLWILFANPLDGGPPVACSPLAAARLAALHADDAGEAWAAAIHDDRDSGTTRWTRTGETFVSLSMTPSVNGHECGHFTLTGGEWR